MENKIYPLGSVVLLKGATKKLLIVSRALNVKKNDKVFYFDYGAVAYPEGILGDEMAYFNHEDIYSILFEGYSEEENESYEAAIREYVKSNPDILRGNIKNWNEEH